MLQVEEIDGLQFSRDAATLQGTLERTRLTRLADMGCMFDSIAFALRGGVNAQGRPCLHIRAAGELQLTCQRCLGPMLLPVSLEVELELCESPREIEEADDDVDRVLARRDMDVAQLVEDEVILCLPIAPKHAQCGPVRGEGAAPKNRPFEVLASLKNKR
jgi:uncharacterized protein